MKEKTLKQLREEYPDIKSNSKVGFLQKLKESKGLGDVVEAVTEATGIKAAVEFFTPEGKDCGCDDRKQRLNDLYSWKGVNCMAESEYQWFTEFKKRYDGATSIDKKDIYELHRLYRRLFRINLKICANCASAGRVISEAVKNIEKIYAEYKI